jgi:hypothetical protein
MAVGSVSEPEYVNRPPAEPAGWLDATPLNAVSQGAVSSNAVRQSGWPQAGDQRPRLGKESGDVNDVVYGQVPYRFFLTSIEIINNVEKVLYMSADGQAMGHFAVAPN